jgi:hypothetical protein
LDVPWRILRAAAQSSFFVPNGRTIKARSDLSDISHLTGPEVFETNFSQPPPDPGQGIYDYGADDSNAGDAPDAPEGRLTLS